MKVRSLILALAAVMGLTFASCEKGGDAESLQLSRSNGVVMQGSTLDISATYGGADVSADATWTSSNEAVATVAAGTPAIITGVGGGDATITCTYQGESVSCTVTVALSGVDAASLLGGSDYYVVLLPQTQYDQLDAEGKISADLRSNGGFEGENLEPADATRVWYVFNPAVEIADAPQTGTNSFNAAEPWFSQACVSPTPKEGWGNIGGGLGISVKNEAGTILDDQVAKLQNLTEDHHLIIILKGKYTKDNKLEIKMNGTSGGDIIIHTVTESTGPNNDGDWEVVDLTYSKLLELGIDFSQPITANTWYPFIYTAMGAGARVDIDAVFFYVPAK